MRRSLLNKLLRMTPVYRIQDIGDLYAGKVNAEIVIYRKGSGGQVKTNQAHTVFILLTIFTASCMEAQHSSPHAVNGLIDIRGID